MKLESKFAAHWMEPLELWGVQVELEKRTKNNKNLVIFTLEQSLLKVKSLKLTFLAQIAAKTINFPLQIIFF